MSLIEVYANYSTAVANSFAILSGVYIFIGFLKKSVDVDNLSLKKTFFFLTSALPLLNSEIAL